MIAKVASLKRKLITILFVLVLSSKEKEDLVVDLLNKGYNIRTIAKSAHLSFTDIGKIRKKVCGEVIEDGAPAKHLSIPAQAFQLFLQNKSLVEVSILLDIPTEEVLKIYSNFLTLQNMKEVAEILKEYKNNLSSFVKLFNYLKKNNIRWKDIKYAIDNKNKINFLNQQKENLEKEVQSMRLSFGKP